MTITLVDALKQDQAEAIIALIDAGATGGKIKIYSGTKPTDADDAPGAGTLLATLVFSVTCGTATAGVITFSSITSDSDADADGTAAWARITDSDDNTVFDASVGTSGEDINLSSVTISIGDSVAISSFTYTVVG